MTILEQLANHAKERVSIAQKELSLDEIKKLAYELPKGNFAFEEALKGEEISFICECKKASPSKGVIAEEFPYLEIAKEYEKAGANCISVLTEPKWFLGNDQYLKEIASKVKIPCIRKDFVVDAYMIYEAKLLGASAVLLICSILSEEQIKEYNKQWKENNKEHKKEYDKQWHQSNPEYNKQWRENNPEYQKQQHNPNNIRI